MRKTLVDRLAERCRDLDGDLVDVLWETCLRQDLEWIGDLSRVTEPQTARRPYRG